MAALPQILLSAVSLSAAAVPSSAHPPRVEPDTSERALGAASAEASGLGPEGRSPDCGLFAIVSDDARVRLVLAIAAFATVR